MMIYPEDFENKIGFPILRNLLTAKCESVIGKKLVAEMSFSSDYKEIVHKLQCTNEMKRILESNISLPPDSFYDIMPAIKMSQAPGAFMPSEKLYECGVTFETMKNLSRFFNMEDNETNIKLSVLKEVFREMPLFNDIEREIFKCLDKGGEVKDGASPALYEVRREIEKISRSMHSVIRRVIEQSIRQGLIEKDVTPAMRDGHLVIPVNGANKRAISGILHDTSATGKTFFIEPAEVVEAGNHLRELQIREEQEIINVLIALTSIIIPHLEEINRGCSLLALYDFIRAKALVAIETGAEMPVMEKEPEIDWFNAKHPGLLLMLRPQKREVVPLSLRLDKTQRILIISGPNAGGKSVALKTVGAVQYMMQCGMLPTLYSNSHMGIFKDIFIDIGDEQSMENDLSTYSSHLANMKYFLTHARKGTLILADEMGSGTEPQIGAALAQAVVLELGKSGCMGVITTHYQNLKMLADTEEGFINGAMMYDRQHFRPTFQLMTGQPGSSFALEIARNIGLPQNVIEQAKDIVGSEYVDSEKFLLDIQRDRKYWKNKRLDIKEKENKLNKLLEWYEVKANELKEQRSVILKNAKEEAKEILKDANSRIENSIHEIRKSQAEKERSKTVRKELDEYKRSLEIDEVQVLPDVLKPLKHKSKRQKENKIKSLKENTIRAFKEGDLVEIENGGVVGKVISISGKKADVAFGSLRMTVDLNKLQHSSKSLPSGAGAPVINSTGILTQSRNRQLNFKQEIDVRGLRADEAIQAVTYFIDDALQFNATRVRILHGTGHGILRTMIREYLNSNQYVKSYHDEDVRLGGAGITIVNLS